MWVDVVKVVLLGALYYVAVPRLVSICEEKSRAAQQSHVDAEADGE